MALTAGTLNVLLLRFPGLLASVVLDVARRPGSTSAYRRVTEALVFTILIALVVRALRPDDLALVPVAFDGETLVWRRGTGAWLAASAGLAVLAALAVSAVRTGDWHMSLLRWARITDRSSRESIWHDVMNREGDRYVVVHLEDGRRLQGYPSYYSNDHEEGALYLTRPAWIEAGPSGPDRVPTGSVGMFVPGASVRLVEFQPNEGEEVERPDDTLDAGNDPPPADPAPRSDLA